MLPTATRPSIEIARQTTMTKYGLEIENFDIIDSR
jgi:hypothetical protein